MTTKVSKLTTLYNMHSHKAKTIIKVMDAYLPYQYINEVITRCKKKRMIINSQYVRDVKRFQKKDPVVLGVILEFAREKQKAHKKLEQLAEKN